MPFKEFNGLLCEEKKMKEFKSVFSKSMEQRQAFWFKHTNIAHFLEPVKSLNEDWC